MCRTVTSSPRITVWIQSARRSSYTGSCANFVKLTYAVRSYYTNATWHLGKECRAYSTGKSNMKPRLPRVAALRASFARSIKMRLNSVDMSLFGCRSPKK